MEVKAFLRIEEAIQKRVSLIDVWMEVKADLRIAYSNQKDYTKIDF